MAQSDFIFNNYSSPYSSSSGLATLNSLLSNPLASSSYGEYCRQYFIPASGVPYGQAFVWNGLISSSNFVGIPGSKAQSLRILARCRESIQPPGDNTTVNVGVRTRCSASNFISGYSLTLGNMRDYFNENGTIFLFNKDTFGLRLSLRKPDGGRDVSNFPDVLISGSFTKDIWYPIRMDVIPFGTLYDTINVYTGSMDLNGEITWSNILYTTNIMSTDSVYNAPNLNQYCGYTVIGDNAGGWGDTSNPARGYIDGLDVRISNV